MIDCDSWLCFASFNFTCGLFSYTHRWSLSVTYVAFLGSATLTLITEFHYSHFLVKLDEINQIQYGCQLPLLAPLYADGGLGLEALWKRRRYLPKIQIGKSVIILIFHV